MATNTQLQNLQIHFMLARQQLQKVQFKYNCVQYLAMQLRVKISCSNAMRTHSAVHNLKSTPTLRFHSGNLSGLGKSCGHRGCKSDTSLLSAIRVSCLENAEVPVTEKPAMQSTEIICSPIRRPQQWQLILRVNKTQLYYPSLGLAHCRTGLPPLATSLSYDRPQKCRATIHSKSNSPSAKWFEFSTKRLAENEKKTIKFTMFAGLTLSLPPI